MLSEISQSQRDKHCAFSLMHASRSGHALGERGESTEETPVNDAEAT